MFIRQDDTACTWAICLKQDQRFEEIKDQKEGNTVTFHKIQIELIRVFIFSQMDRLAYLQKISNFWREKSANNNLRCEAAYKIREKLQPQSELGLYSVITESFFSRILPLARLLFN